MTPAPQRPSANDPPAASPPRDRRGFLGQSVAWLGGAAALTVPTVIGVIAFLNPLRMRSRAGRYMRLASLDMLSEDGTPQRFSIVADRTDAWSRFPKESIGAVFLRRIGDDQVEALQVVCPHAGCSIQHKGSGESGKFFCPCHAASFDLGGKRLDKNSPSPRDMDTLEVEIRNRSEVWVKYEDFVTGTSQKTEET